MHIHTSIYTYILFTACGPLKHQRVMTVRTIVLRLGKMTSVDFNYKTCLVRVPNASYRCAV